MYHFYFFRFILNMWFMTVCVLYQKVHDHMSLSFKCATRNVVAHEEKKNKIRWAGDRKNTTKKCSVESQLFFWPLIFVCHSIWFEFLPFGIYSFDVREQKKCVIHINKCECCSALYKCIIKWEITWQKWKDIKYPPRDLPFHIIQYYNFFFYVITYNHESDWYTFTIYI